MRAFIAVLLALPLAAFAQSWPAKPLRLIAPYATGGQTDIVSRWLAERVGPVLGQPITVENRAGAQGIIGIEAAKNAAPDGYTFVYVNLSNIAINPHVYAKLPYDPLRDLAPVTQLGLTVLPMVVPASLGVRNVRDFVAWVRANPGKTSYASIGNGSTPHLFGEMLNAAARLDMTHVPYKGAGPAVQDMLAGQMHMGMLDFAAVNPHLSSGRFVALAVTGTRRWPSLPDVPTFAEQGYALELTGWNGIMAPAAVPRATIERLAVEISRAVQSPEGRQQMQNMGLLATGSSPEEFGDIIRRDTQRWGEVVRSAGVKLQ